jgi:glucose-6-phosphate-specific signal transduction histidine kinase
MIAEQLALGQFGPWFRRRPRLAVDVSALLALATWGLGLALPEGRPALAVLFALPIALLAVTFGYKGGVVAGLGAMVSILAWGLAAGRYGIGASGWASAVAVLTLGALLGAAVDGLEASEQRVRRADSVRRRLDQIAHRQREAVEINDTFVQSVAVAKWALEAGDVERALEVLEETVDSGQRLVTALFNGDRLPYPQPGRASTLKEIEHADECRTHSDRVGTRK